MPDKETQQLINSIRTLGNTGITVYLEDHELLKLCAVVATDLGFEGLVSDYVDPAQIHAGYYSIKLAWFREPLTAQVVLEERILILRDNIQDFLTYLKSLAELHKRRLKYEAILEKQPMPQMVQIVPRGLLEYGMRPTGMIASWLMWRKWIYDIDNRSAQETGYLFEPILTSSLGGVSYSATKSPIKRTRKSTMGRQVDCVEGKTAYEFKMRVTIAASGQGRFGEELSFAEDCSTSGFRPVLLVLDPTPSARLDELSREYQRYGGDVFLGDSAWEYVKQKSGATMGAFVEKYVEGPIREIESDHETVMPLSLNLEGENLTVRIGEDSFSITRHPVEELADVEADKNPETQE